MKKSLSELVARVRAREVGLEAETGAEGVGVAGSERGVVSIEARDGKGISMVKSRRVAG
jgi:hypothetical protein